MSVLSNVRIAFLFNHDQIHQVAHSLPIAIALSNANPIVEIIVATTNDKLKTEVARMVGLLGGANIKFIDLRLRGSLSRCISDLLNPFLPAAKVAIYRDHLEFFSSLDALVVAEKTSQILKGRYNLHSLKLIHTRHGAGDRAIGFNKASAKFDQVLVSGPKIKDRLLSETELTSDQIDMVGYPKFDVLPEVPARLPFQENGRPTILYNPHVSPHLSSWYRDGRRVLDFFVDHPEYNLIFAPHVMLFERPFVVTIDKLRVHRPGHLDDRHLQAKNIHIDLGSRLSTDMTYTMAADLYLGDVSSQIYEFLLKPRPCVFLNSHRVAYGDDPNYAHWQAGAVIGSSEDLGPALKGAWKNHSNYIDTQRGLFSCSFDLTKTPSSVRAAHAILKRLGMAYNLPAPLMRETGAPVQVAVG